jgi:hypothetical protein
MEPETPAAPRRRVAELIGAALLLLWRVLAVPFPQLRTDWLALVAVFWVVTVATERSKARPWITVGAMTILLAIYLSGQLPAAAAFLKATL